MDANIRMVFLRCWLQVFLFPVMSRISSRFWFLETVLVAAMRHDACGDPLKRMFPTGGKLLFVLLNQLVLYGTGFKSK